MLRESQIDSFLYRLVCYGVHILCLAFASTIVALIILVVANIFITLTKIHVLATLVALNAAGLIIAVQVAYQSISQKKDLLRNKIEYICPLCCGCNIEFAADAEWSREFQIYIPKRIGDAVCIDCDMPVQPERRLLLKSQRQSQHQKD